MADFDAELDDEITIPFGATCTLESIRLATVGSHAFAIPFVETPSHVSLARQVAHDEGGWNGLVFTLRGNRTGCGSLRVGFRDLRSQQIVAEKVLRVTVR